MKLLKLFFVLLTSALLFSSCEDILDSISDPVNNPEFVVNTTEDTPDADLTDGLCADANGNCSFRAAIQEVNNDRKLSYTIKLPGKNIGVETYQLDSALIIKGGLIVNIEGEFSYNTVIKANGMVTNSPAIIIDTDDEVSVINIKELTITGGKADLGGFGTAQPSGGGLLMSGSRLKVVLENVVVSNNYALVNGGGILNNGGDLTLKNCLVRDNICDNRTGGGIYNLDILRIENSSIISNSSGRNPSQADVSGAGIFNKINGKVYIENSTIGLNKTTSLERVNGVAIFNYGKMTVRSSTIAENNPNLQTTGIHNFGDSLILLNTAIVNSKVEGSNIYSYGGNFIDQLEASVTITAKTNANATWADYFGTTSSPLDAKLGSLQGVNNDLLQYYIPQVGSPLIDKAIAITPGFDHPDACLDIDQRGQPRTGICDIGAIEVQ